MAFIERITDSRLLDSVISSKIGFRLVKSPVDLGAGAFICICYIPLFNYLLMAALALSILLGFKAAIAIPFIFILSASIFFNRSEAKLKASAPLLIFFFFGKVQKQLVDFAVFMLVIIGYIVWLFI